MEELDVRVALFADILSFQTPDCSKLYPGTTSVSMVSRVFIRETSRGNRIFHRFLCWDSLALTGDYPYER